LPAEQVLDGMEVWRGVRFDGDAVLRPQSMEVKRRHDGRERRRRGLMATDFQSVIAVAHMVGVVDRPSREPQHFAFKLGQYGEILRRAWRRHQHAPMSV